MRKGKPTSEKYQIHGAIGRSSKSPKLRTTQLSPILECKTLASRANRSTLLATQNVVNEQQIYTFIRPNLRNLFSAGHRSCLDDCCANFAGVRPQGSSVGLQRLQPVHRTYAKMTPMKFCMFLLKFHTCQMDTIKYLWPFNAHAQQLETPDAHLSATMALSVGCISQRLLHFT